jgi:peptidylprolyl isomerase/FKBP-type peptidyl-prolyl cis-trans isomerase FklB
MPLDGLIPGWVEALQLMRPGDEWRIFVPSALGYGEEGGGPIPPGATLIFRIELIDSLPGPRRVSGG